MKNINKTLVWCSFFLQIYSMDRELFHEFEQSIMSVVQIEDLDMMFGVGRNINEQDDQGATALMYAASQGRLDIVQWLLDHGADVNLQNIDGQTALVHAILKNHEYIVRLLLQHGADINLQDDQGTTPCIAAAFKGNKNVVQSLLDQRVNINTQDYHGRTALMNAVLYKHEDIAHLLISSGANLNAQYKDGTTVLPLAVLKNRLAVVATLLQQKHLKAHLVVDMVHKLKHDYRDVPIKVEIMQLLQDYIQFQSLQSEQFAVDLIRVLTRSSNSGKLHSDIALKIYEFLTPMMNRMTMQKFINSFP